MKHPTKRALTLLLTLCLMLGLLPELSGTARADGDTSAYTLTIPATLTVANSGWNATDGISATGTLASGKKLTVTADSANSWALKSGDNSVGYKLATASTDTEATTSWEFDSLSDTSTTKPMGIIVEDYSTKPAGTYQDTVTFTAHIVDAFVAVTAITINKTEIGLGVGSTETLSVATVTPNDAIDQTVTWSSSNEAVATVNATTGVVTAVAAGTATITATANDGSGVTATCAVTVTTLASAFENGATVRFKVYVRSNFYGYLSFRNDNGTFTFTEKDGGFVDNAGTLTRDGVNLILNVTPMSEENGYYTITVNTSTGAYSVSDGTLNSWAIGYLQSKGLANLWINGVDLTDSLSN